MGVGPICAVLTGRAAVSRPPAPKASHAVGLLGDSSTVEQRTLTPLILVRIQVPQPKNPQIPIKLNASRRRAYYLYFSIIYAIIIFR